MSEEIIETQTPSEDIQATEASEPKEDRPIVLEEAIEAILFAAGHPVSYATLARVFDMTPSKVKDRIFDYAMKYNRPSELNRGVILLAYQDNCQLCTKELYLPEIRDALGIRKSGTLSTSSMETLAVVAYNQPVTRVFVDTIRKVDSSYAMNNLIDRGLIECVGRLDVPGRPMQYGTTSDFLRCFGLSSISDLPSASDELISMFEKASGELTQAEDSSQLTITDVDENAIPMDQKTDTENPEMPENNEAEMLFHHDEDDLSAEDDIMDID